MRWFPGAADKGNDDNGAATIDFGYTTITCSHPHRETGRWTVTDHLGGICVDFDTIWETWRFVMASRQAITRASEMGAASSAHVELVLEGPCAGLYRLNLSFDEQFLCVGYITKTTSKHIISLLTASGQRPDIQVHVI